MLLIFFLSLITIGILMNFKILYFISLIIIFLHLIVYQIKNLNVEDPNEMFKKI